MSCKRGLSTVEYVIIAVLIAIAGLAAFRAFGPTLVDRTQASADCVANMTCEGVASNSEAPPALVSAAPLRGGAIARVQVGDIRVTPRPQQTAAPSRPQRGLPGLSPELDAAVAKHPELMAAIEAAKGKGTTFRWGSNGEGTYFAPGSNEVVLEERLSRTTSSALAALVHEVGHANDQLLIVEPPEAVAARVRDRERARETFIAQSSMQRARTEAIAAMAELDFASRPQVDETHRAAAEEIRRGYSDKPRDARHSIVELHDQWTSFQRTQPSPEKLEERRQQTLERIGQLYTTAYRQSTTGETYAENYRKYFGALFDRNVPPPNQGPRTRLVLPPIAIESTHSHEH